MPLRDKTLQRKYRKKWAENLKREVIIAYGAQCICCGETIFEFLSIDHIDNSGAIHRKQLGISSGSDFYTWLKRQGFPKDNFQLLCMNCNFAKGRYGICPHQVLTN